jgi:hypothetical protein
MYRIPRWESCVLSWVGWSVLAADIDTELEKTE